MANDGNPVHAEQGCPAGLRVVQQPENLLEILAGLSVAQGTRQQAHDEARHRFVKLEKHVSDESITNEYITSTLDNSTALDVADEVEAAFS